MISQFFVLSQRGDNIVFSDYRGEVQKGSTEFFFRKVKFWKEDDQDEAQAPPVFPLKLSDDLHLNEIDCVRLLVSANQEAVVLDQGLEADNVLDIQKYLEDLISNGLRLRLISLIKELGRAEPAGLGGPQCEQYVLDFRGTLVERRAVVCRERLVLGHCLLLSVLIVRTRLPRSVLIHEEPSRKSCL